MICNLLSGDTALAVSLRSSDTMACTGLLQAELAAIREQFQPASVEQLVRKLDRSRRRRVSLGCCAATFRMLLHVGGCTYIP